jgi:cobalt transporter subunit CbtB
MNTSSQHLHASATAAQSRLAQIGLLALLGIFVVGFSGFVQIDAVHNAGHDYRHSMGFPCH